MDSNDSETVTISRKEYDQLQKDTDMLNALEACGVDNWEGIPRRTNTCENKRKSRSRKPTPAHKRAHARVAQR